MTETERLHMLMSEVVQAQGQAALDEADEALAQANRASVGQWGGGRGPYDPASFQERNFSQSNPYVQGLAKAIRARDEAEARRDWIAQALQGEAPEWTPEADPSAVAAETLGKYLAATGPSALLDLRKRLGHEAKAAEKPYERADATLQARLAPDGAHGLNRTLETCLSLLAERERCRVRRDILSSALEAFDADVGPRVRAGIEALGGPERLAGCLREALAYQGKAQEDGLAKVNYLRGRLAEVDAELGLVASTAAKVVPGLLAGELGETRKSLARDLAAAERDRHGLTQREAQGIVERALDGSLEDWVRVAEALLAVPKAFPGDAKDWLVEAVCSLVVGEHAETLLSLFGEPAGPVTIGVPRQNRRHRGPVSQGVGIALPPRPAGSRKI